MAKRRPVSQLAFVVVLLAVAIIASGCGASFVKVKDFKKGSVLLLPSRNAVQGGQYHAYEGGKSGPMLDQHILELLRADGWEVYVTDSEAFSNLEIPSVEEQLAEAKRLGADYVLHIELGEFLDAAPFTFRSDYVYLVSATLHDSRTKELLWKTKEPARYDTGTNLGTMWSVFQTMARDVASFIKSNVDK